MRFFFMLMIAALGSGCGYKGPLTLPQPKATAAKPLVKPEQPPAERATPPDSPVVPQ